MPEDILKSLNLIIFCLLEDEKFPMLDSKRALRVERAYGFGCSRRIGDSVEIHSTFTAKVGGVARDSGPRSLLIPQSVAVPALFLLRWWLHISIPRKTEILMSF